MGKATSVKENKTPWYQQLIGFVIGLIFLSFFSLFIESGWWKILLVIIPVFIIIKTLFFPSSNSKFFKKQAILPTSKAASAAMGMVELIGDLEQIEPLISPYFKKECIGYFYRIEEEGQPDKDGKRSYYTTHFEQKIGIFNLLDETGFVKVDGTDLEFPFVEADDVKVGKKRHSEGYLLHNDYVMFMGYASSEDGKTLIKKEGKNIFIIANPSKVETYNASLPLLNSFLITLFIATLLILFILLN